MSTTNKQLIKSTFKMVASAYGGADSTDSADSSNFLCDSYLTWLLYVVDGMLIVHVVSDRKLKVSTASWLVLPLSPPIPIYMFVKFLNIIGIEDSTWFYCRDNVVWVYLLFCKFSLFGCGCFIWWPIVNHWSYGLKFKKHSLII